MISSSHCFCTVTKDKDYRGVVAKITQQEEAKSRCERTHRGTCAITGSLSVTAQPGWRIFNLWPLWQGYTPVISADGSCYVLVWRCTEDLRTQHWRETYTHVFDQIHTSFMLQKRQCPGRDDNAKFPDEINPLWSNLIWSSCIYSFKFVKRQPIDVQASYYKLQLGQLAEYVTCIKIKENQKRTIFYHANYLQNIPHLTDWFAC